MNNRRVKHRRTVFYKGVEEGANNLNCYTFKDTKEDITYKWVTQSMKLILDEVEESTLLRLDFEVKLVTDKTVTIVNPSYYTLE